MIKQVNETFITDNPLINAALPVLALCFADNKQPEDFNRLLEMLTAFKVSLNTQNPKRDNQIHYLLCSAIDEFLFVDHHGLSSTHLGQQTTLLHFHQDNLGGIKFFDITGELLQDPKQNIMAIEFVYLLLVLGFQGQYRLVTEGKKELAHLLEKLKVILQQERAKPKRLNVRKKSKRTQWRTYLLGFLFLTSIGLFTVFQISLYHAAKPTAMLIQQLKQDQLS